MRGSGGCAPSTPLSYWPCPLCVHAALVSGIPFCQRQWTEGSLQPLGWGRSIGWLGEAATARNRSPPPCFFFLAGLGPRAPCVPVSTSFTLSLTPPPTHPTQMMPPSSLLLASSTQQPLLATMVSQSKTTHPPTHPPTHLVHPPPTHPPTHPFPKPQPFVKVLKNKQYFKRYQTKFRRRRGT